MLRTRGYKILLAFCSLSLSALSAPSIGAQSGRAKSSRVKPPIVQGPVEARPNQDGADRNADLATELDGERIYKSKEVDKRPWVTKTPEPKYTREARKKAVEGVVILRCIFRSTGEVTNIYVISGLGYGLTDRTIEVAKKIAFKPAIKDGKPVSMWMELQYNFRLY